VASPVTQRMPPILLVTEVLSRSRVFVFKKPREKKRKIPARVSRLIDPRNPPRHQGVGTPPCGRASSQVLN
jgi:hypothetical protein